MDDLISRQVAIDALCKSECGWNNAECRHKDGTDFCVTCDNVKIIKSLPSVQPEPAIPLQWIEGQIKWLKSMDNAFATLSAEQISALVNKWKDEQDG